MSKRHRAIDIGSRVRLKEPPLGLVATVLTGTVARPCYNAHGPLADRFMVDLDEPALFVHADLKPVELCRIGMTIDEMELLR